MCSSDLCYTGQELVARVDSRGNNVPRRLAVLHFGAAGAIPEMPAELFVADEAGALGPAGQLTSAAFSQARRAIVALGYIRRAVELPATVQLADGRRAEARRVEAS